MTDENGVLDHVHIGDGQGYIMSGISYWTKSNAAKIVNRIDRLIENESYKDLFWDNAVIDSIPVLDSIKVDGVDGIYEIDTVEELRELEGELY